MSGFVRAVYNYTYVYEGTKISFKKDEEFQLLAKSNKDWWQVRRWGDDGCAQDIYVPAVYVKEVQTEKKKRENFYQNINDVRKQVEELSLKENGEQEGSTKTGKIAVPPILVKLKKGNDPPVLKRTDSEASGKATPTVMSPVHKNPLQGRKSVDYLVSSEKSNGVDAPKSDPFSTEMLLKLSRPSYKKTEITDPPSLTEVQPNISAKPRSNSVNADANSYTSTSVDGSLALKSTSSFPKSQGGVGKTKLPPPVLPKSQKTSSDRPKSMVVLSPTSNSPPEVGEPPVSVGALASGLELTFTRQVNHSFASSVESGKLLQSPSTKQAGEVEANKTGELSSKKLGLKKTPSPMTFSANIPVSANGQPEPPEVSSPAMMSSSYSIPAGWTQHMTSSGHTYYYHSASGHSSWTRPSETTSSAENTHSQLEKLPPRGWTRQINPITSTPIYTNCRTGERWSVASDEAGNFYYYNMANSLLAVGELPAVLDIPETHGTPTRTISTPQENIYDTLALVGDDSEGDPKDSPGIGVSSLTSQLEMFANTLSGSVLKKHTYLSRRKMYDAQGKKVKSNWQRLYVILEHSELLFYLDHKSKETPGAKPLSVFPLLHCTVSPYPKEKKKTIFQISSPFGEQFLLQADSTAQMNDWYSTIQTIIDSTNQEYKDHPEKFRDVALEGDVDQNSPKTKSKYKSKIRSLGRQSSNSDDICSMIDDEGDPMDMDVSQADRSVRVRTRLKKLMAKRPQADQLKKKGILEDPVFGCELKTLCEREGTNVPKFLVKFIDHIEKTGLDTVGIYRLSGNAASVTKLRYNVEQEEDIDLNDSDWADVNIVTGCLKLFLRELPDPIIPFKMFRNFIDAARSPSQIQRVQNIAARVKELPTPNYSTLKALIIHFKKVVEYGHINKMQSSNIAIVFGPTLMRAEMDSMEMAILMPVQNGIVEVMINDFKSVFRK